MAAFRTCERPLRGPFALVRPLVGTLPRGFPREGLQALDRRRKRCHESCLSLREINGLLRGRWA
jgi:hypothetical protein